MKRTSVFLLIFISLLLFMTDNSIAQEKWELKKTKSGITIYTRDVDGSKYKEFKGIGTINAPLELVGLVLLDIANHKTWMPDFKESVLVKDLNGTLKDIKNASSGDVIQYYRIKTPWPLSDRDLVVKCHAEVNWKTGVFTIDSKVTDGYVPEKKGVVRIPYTKVKWVLKRTKDNKTSVVYTSLANSGGSIPASLVNFASVNIPYETLSGLRKMVKKEKYIKQSKEIFGLEQ